MSLLRRQPRLLPIVAVAASLVLTLKVVDLMSASTARAEEHAEAPAAEAPAAPAPAPEATAAAPAPETSVPVQTASFDPAAMSAAEIRVLQNLAARRQALDERERQIEMRARLIEAAEQRVEGRVTELKEIQASIKTMLGQRDEAAAAQLKALVKMYETMKPSDAAAIMETMDEGVLLDVLQGMKPVKTSAILAAMKPDRARDITILLARRLDVPETIAAVATEAPAEIVPTPVAAEPVPSETPALSDDESASVTEDMTAPEEPVADTPAPADAAEVVPTPETPKPEAPKPAPTAVTEPAPAPVAATEPPVETAAPTTTPAPAAEPSTGETSTTAIEGPDQRPARATAGPTTILPPAATTVEPPSPAPPTPAATPAG